jgi:hypothetical protein
VRSKHWIPFLAAFVVPLFIVYVWWGGFNPVHIEPGQQRGPYTYAYMEQAGDYSKLTDLQMRVAAELSAQRIGTGRGIAVLYSDPDKVDVGKRVARTGYLIAEGVDVAPPLKRDTIPARKVLLVQVQAAVLLAPSRAYQALIGYLKDHGEPLRMPTVEIYAPSDTLFSNGVLSVEMQEGSAQ